MTSLALPRNSEATALAEAGLQASLAGEQVTAREHYTHALSAINLDGSPAAAAQAGAVLRDCGFTYTREAIASRDPGLFNEARTRLYEAAAETAPFVSGVQVTGAEQITPVSMHQHRELVTEHLATLTLLARTATAQEAVIARLDATEADRGLYTIAHSLGHIGLNGYYWTSNAVNAARDNYLLERGTAASNWVAIAARILTWTNKHDTPNLQAATRTYITHQSYRQNRQAALASIHTHP